MPNDHECKNDASKREKQAIIAEIMRYFELLTSKGKKEYISMLTTLKDSKIDKK